MELSSDRVLLWLFDVEKHQSPAEQLANELSPGEQTRARAFLQDQDRLAFLLGRGALRRLLSRCAPSVGEIGTLVTGPWGKPSLDTGAGHSPGVEFNISHSGGLVLLAATWGTPVGIDLEVPRPGVELQEILERFFSRGEVAEWHRLPPGLRSDGFYSLWTRKEAVVKALGRGLSLPLDSFQVTLDPREPCRLILAPPGTPPAEHWTVRDLTGDLRGCLGVQASPAFAALALPGSPFQYEYRPAEELLA
jgi:4'-phosphopantetheinyl transferase